jgi:hypothetical protein
MRRKSWILAGPIALLALAACQDGVVSPSVSRLGAPGGVAPAPMSLAPQGRPTLSLSGGLPDSTATSFAVGPSGGLFFTGNHAVVFPAGSVCDPATSSYGPGTWDDPCTPLASSIRVHAEVRRADGRTSIEFTPHLRFVPSSNSAKWVWLVLYSPDAVGASSDLSQFNVWWAPSRGATLVDETLFDPTLRTYVDTMLGISVRRLKHFSIYQSGYGLASGKTCDPAQEGC